MTKIVEHNKNSLTINLVYGSILLVFFLSLILFGPEELPEYKHNLVAVTSSLLVGVFGFFLTGEIGLKINTNLLENKFGKIAIQASGGIALFVLTMIWWRSPLAPIENIQDKIIQEQQKGTAQTIAIIDSSTTNLSQTIKEDGNRTREVVIDASIAELEGMFPLAVRIDRDVDGTIVHFNGEEEIPLISYERNRESMKLMWGDRFHYYIFSDNSQEDIEGLGKIFLQLSNNRKLPIELSLHESEIRIPGSNPNEITAKFLNPNHIRGLHIKITIYSADRERGRELFKDALMNTTLSSRARQIYKELNKDGVRLRKAPNDRAEIFRTLREGTYLKVMKDTAGFSLVRLPEGRKGWVKSEFISKIN